MPYCSQIILSSGAPCLPQTLPKSHPCVFPCTLPSLSSLSPLVTALPSQSPATSSAGTGHAYTIRAPACFCEDKGPHHHADQGPSLLICPWPQLSTWKPQTWFLRVITQQGSVVQASVAWKSSPLFPTPNPKPGTARERAGSQCTQVSKPQLCL